MKKRRYSTEITALSNVNDNIETQVTTMEELNYQKNMRRGGFFG